MKDAAILLVDDEQAILQLLETVLRKEGFETIDKAKTAEEALAACEKKAYDLIVLDVTLPQMSGIDACPFIRRLTEAPILFLSARNTDFDKLTGFAVGGDDYVTKPFNPMEIVARIRALLRRSRKLQPVDASAVNGVFDFGRFQVHEIAGELYVEGKLIACPSLVFQLLLFLCKNPNRIFAKSELYERVWGEHSIRDDNTIMVHIHRIRERIEPDPAQPEYLVNVRGLGYKLMKKGLPHEL
ncbi:MULTISPECIES: response regulator transcription factor [Brevibacillus]|uniref:response regulator transcription factor n=1 Tax=Brevibacillus TaxID=55080 RepID=UPI000ECF96CC|nr:MULTISPECIES: response regulator transcription factor [Brevibacillus]MDR5001820.1 response regulator transcription factor [Brevibacillus parabrevis]MED2253438.1 response regulator transcription factor [Brevibacillus parabrevis]WDV94313.1 response regulator transcription factor [Brevibacillus parabrevis]HBZ81279.1 DNA-binding response regulator [Brevibacillus sp.]